VRSRCARPGLSTTVLHARRPDRSRERELLCCGEAAAIAQALGRSLDELVKVSAASTFEPPKMGRLRRADRP